MQPRDPVSEQAELAHALMDGLRWHGSALTEASVLDALGMAGLVLSRYDEQADLNPASVAAILSAIDDEPSLAGPGAQIFELDAYRVISAV